jgi:prefoldin subunit 5
MATRPHDDAATFDELSAEHQTLKAQTAELRQQHDRLHLSGATKAEHQQHIRNLRAKIKELERHVEKLKHTRQPP